jgi:hypothetical protein
VVAHLAGLSARPVAARVLDLAPATVDALYHRQPKIPRNHVWMHTATMAGGPLAALLVTGEPGLNERLYAAKGPTSATADSAADSIRRLFGRASSTHAVVHIPEDLAAFVAEGTLFFPWEEMTTARDPLPGGVTEDLVALEPRPGLPVFQSVARVKRRVAAALWLRLRASEPAVALRKLTAAVDSDLDGLDYSGQRNRLLEFAAEERPLLERVIAEAEAAVTVPVAATRAAAWRGLGAATGAVELAYAGWFLSGHEPYGGDGGERLFGALERNDVPLSPAQRLLLSSALGHDLHPGSRSGGERVWPLGPDPGGAFG